MKKVIISGGTGAIGMALIQTLLQRDVQILVIAHRGSERVRNIVHHPNIQILEANLDEFADLNLPEKDYDVFYHLAWSGTFGEARNDLYHQIDNIRYTLDAAALAHRSGCHTFIGAGSQAEYGRYEGKLTPDTPTNPENGYGMAKLCAGQMSRQMCQQLGMRHIWTRILSVYGPYDGDNTMISSAIRSMLKKEPTHFTKGEQLWDYLYSGDAAQILFLLGKAGKHGEVYVLGSGDARPLREYIEIIAEKIGMQGDLGIGDVAYGEKQVMHLEADVSKLEEDLGYTPLTSFEQGIEKTIKYHKQDSWEIACNTKR